MIALLLAACAPPPPGGPSRGAAPAACPPAGEEGPDLGDTVEDLAFETCAGAPVSLHGGCGRVQLVVNVYGWCGPCLEHLDLAAALRQLHPDLSTVAVITEDVLGGTPDLTFCADLTEAYAVEGTVAVDPTRALEDRYGGPGLVLLIDADGVLRFARTDATEEVIAAAVAELLPPASP